MWLINTSTLQLREFTRSTPPYATFSHVTGENEASFEDLAQTQQDNSKESWKIIQRACAQARTAGLEWLWNHAACVDKRSYAAQSEAINSLPQIYRDCEYNIIYLEDFDCERIEAGAINESLAECRWIKNIWAIPQIVFPREASFYSSDWNQIGTKKSLLPHLSSIIGIDQPVLEDSNCLEDYSIARRMSWASEKTALRIEDSAYAFLGLFSVSTPIIYGEGQNAFLRLQEEIMRDTDDFSLFAWDNLDVHEYKGLFARSPACFHRFQSGPKSPFRINGEVQLHCTDITIQASFFETQIGLFLPLKGQDISACCIHLSQWNGRFVRRGNQVKWALPGKMSLDNRRICIKRDVSAHLSRKISAYEGFVRDCSLQPLDESDTARASSCSIMDFNSNDGTGRMAPSVEKCGLTSQYATCVSWSEVTSHDELIAWLAHDRGSVEEPPRALDSDVRPSPVHESSSDVHFGPDDCSGDDTGEAKFHSPYRGSAGKEANDGSPNSTHSNGSPPTEAQVLDVAQVTTELADIAIEQFVSGHQSQGRKRSFTSCNSRKRTKPMHSSNQVEDIFSSDCDDGETVLVKKTGCLACPFYVQNNKYTKCVTRHVLRTIEEVKEHVCWAHRRPMFCPVCKEEFPSARDRDAHIRLRVCHANTSPIPEGITDDQEELLDRKEKSSIPEDLGWFQIWDIVFPDVERPSSTSYIGEREASVCAFQQFWMQSGEETIADFLQRKDCRSYSIQNEERKLQAIFDLVMKKVVDRIFVEFKDFTRKY